MLILGVDVETTGLSTEKDKIIEIGAVVWDTEQSKPVAMLNHLVKQPELMPLEEKIIKVTGITETDLNQFGLDEGKAMEEFILLAEKCEYILAHNGNKFDKPIVDKALASHGLILDKHWIDSMLDVAYPTSTRNLTHLAAEHSFLNPFAHRALFDVLTMLTVCDKYNWSEIVERSRSPEVLVIAKVTKNERFLAKEKRFRWDPQNTRWIKNMRQYDLDKTKFDFETEIVSLS